MSWFSKWFKKKKTEDNSEKSEGSDISKINEGDSPKGYFDEESMTPEEENKFIEKAAKTIVDRGFGFPAEVLLESSKPFTYIGEQFFYFFSPFLGVFNFEGTGQRYKNFFTKPENIDRLLKRIQELSR